MFNNFIMRRLLGLVPSPPNQVLLARETGNEANGWSTRSRDVDMEEGGMELELEGPVWRTCEDMELKEGELAELEATLSHSLPPFS